MSSRFRAGLAVAFGLLVAACGSSAAPAAQPAAPAPAQSQAPKSLTPVKLTFSWFPGPNQLPADYALQQGYFKDAGLDVSLTLGKGSDVATKQVAVGQFDFGLVDLPTAALEREGGAPVKAVYVEIARTPYAFWTDKSITDWKGLKGKSVAASATVANYMLPAVLNKVGLSMKEINLVTATPATVDSAYYTNKTDALINDYGTNSPLVDPHRSSNHLFLDTVLDMPNVGIVARDDYLASHADVTRKLLAALGKAQAKLAADPAAVKEISEQVAKENTGTKAEDVIQGWALYKDFLRSDAQQGHPQGWMPPAMWQQTIDILHTYAGLKQDLNPQSYYTNEYLGNS